MKVFISADIEGTAGITTVSEGDRATPDWAEYRDLMTKEVIAACEGAREAGATEVVIKDAHHTGRNILVGQLPGYVRIARSWSGHPYELMQPIDGSFAAAVCTGYHAMATDPGNPLSHTMLGNRIHRLSINGRPMSEYHLAAYICGHAGVPIVFVAGDAAICRTASSFIGATSTVATLEGIGHSTLSIAPVKARELIKEGVYKALKGDLAACRTPMPERFDMEIELRIAAEIYSMSFYPGMEAVEPNLLRFSTDDCFEMLKAFEYFMRGPGN